MYEQKDSSWSVLFDVNLSWTDAFSILLQDQCTHLCLMRNKVSAFLLHLMAVNVGDQMIHCTYMFPIGNVPWLAAFIRLKLLRCKCYPSLHSTVSQCRTKANERLHSVHASRRSNCLPAVHLSAPVYSHHRSWKPPISNFLLSTIKNEVWLSLFSV